VQNRLVSVQPEFKSELLNGVAEFKISVEQFVNDYNDKYAVVTGNFEHTHFLSVNISVK